MGHKIVLESLIGSTKSLTSSKIPISPDLIQALLVVGFIGDKLKFVGLRLFDGMCPTLTPKMKDGFARIMLRAIGKSSVLSLNYLVCQKFIWICQMIINIKGYCSII